MRTNYHPKLTGLVLLSILLTATSRLKAEAEPALQVVPIQQWFYSIQKFAFSYRPKSTQAATKLEYDRLMENLDKEFDPSKVKFRVKVTGVTWANGTAKIYTENELPLVKGANLQIHRRAPFEVVLTEEQSAAIRPGTLFEFEGTMTFQKGGWGTTSRCQQLYQVDHKEFRIAGVLGTFVSRDYKCLLGGIEVPGRWANNEKEAESQ